MKLPSNTFDQNSHPNNELLDLLGYGLAKFNGAIISEFGFSTKIAFYQYFVDLRIAETFMSLRIDKIILTRFLRINAKAGGKKVTPTYIAKNQSTRFAVT